MGREISTDLGISSWDVMNVYLTYTLKWLKPHDAGVTDLSISKLQKQYQFTQRVSVAVSH